MHAWPRRGRPTARRRPRSSRARPCVAAARRPRARGRAPDVPPPRRRDRRAQSATRAPRAPARRGHEPRRARRASGSPPRGCPRRPASSASARRRCSVTALQPGHVGVERLPRQGMAESAAAGRPPQLTTAVSIELRQAHRARQLRDELEVETRPRRPPRRPRRRAPPARAPLAPASTASRIAVGQGNVAAVGELEPAAARARSASVRSSARASSSTKKGMPWVRS